MTTNFSSILVLATLLIASNALAADGPYKVKPFEFVGTKNQCAPSPKGKDTLKADWKDKIGLPDASGNKFQGLLLEKRGPTANCAAAGAVIEGVEDIVLVEIGFDIKDGSHCGGGAPRFNVQASDGFHFLGGCGNATQTPNFPVNGWTRVRIDPLNPAQAFPPLAPGAVIESIDIIFDEGEDTSVPGAGTAILDNIQIKSENNEVLITKSGFAS